MNTRSILVAAGTALAGLTAYAMVIRPRHLRWGATDEEFHEALPGDEVVPHPEHHDTHAITIAAPVTAVWPWLVQMGQNRGGFYSYTWLENLAGCRMRNADRIVPAWQHLEAGDQVWLHPKAPPLPVLRVEPDQAIVLGGPTGTWAFYLKKQAERSTRLLVRGRWPCQRGMLSWLGRYALLEPSHVIMERKTMLGIKARAEASMKHTEVLGVVEAS
jgi:hypothetical protein